MILVIGGRAQGKHGFAEAAFPGKQIYELDEYLKKAVGAGHSADVIGTGLDGFIKKASDGVVITTIIGNGIVPVKKEDREFRETVGSAQIRVAGEASGVYRVTAGIGERIK